MVSDRLRALVRCPACRAELHGSGSTLRCCGCGADYGAHGDFIDLRPRERFSEQTRYLDDALHADARDETVSPPLLSAGVRHHMLLKFLRPSPGDRVLDLGCGSGRVMVWNRPSGAYHAGLDVSPFFAREARESVDLALGDLRRLPFADGSFNKAYALDVFEHLSREALRQMLDEIYRVLEPGGQVFVYSHVRRNSRLALGLRAINRAARGLERIGLVDLTQERLRKSDHVNPLADVADLDAVVRAAGLPVARIRYYTPLLAGLAENIGVRVVERWMTHRAGAKRARAAGGAGTGPEAGAGAGCADGAAMRAARTAAKARVGRPGPTLALLRAVTWLLRLDVALWGRVRSGPFFALLAKEASR